MTRQDTGKSRFPAQVGSRWLRLAPGRPCVTTRDSQKLTGYAERYPVGFWGCASWCGCGLVLSTPVSAVSTAPACRRACLARVGFAMFAATARPAPHPAASGGGPRGDGSPFASPAARRSPAGGVHPASATRFRRAGSRWRRPRRAQRPRRGYPPRLAANAEPAPLAPSPGRYSARVRGGRGRRRHWEAQVRCRGAPADASRRGLGGEHAGRRSRQAAHGRRRAEEGAKGAPAAEGTPSAPSKWMGT